MDKSVSPQSLVNGYLFDGQGGARTISWDEINTWKPEDGLLWINLDYAAKETHEWVTNQSKLDPLIISSLLAEYSSPRCFLTGDGALLNLRGVNFTPASDYDDMVSIRVWFDESRIISIQRHHLFSIEELISSIEKGIGPRTTGEFIVDLSTEVLEKTSIIIAVMEKRIDHLQDHIDEQEPIHTRRKLSICRRKIVMMRRYTLPQRDALIRIQTDRITWLNDIDRIHLREVSDRTTRYIEDLDAVRDRATIVQEELISRTSEQISNKIYLLSMVAVYLYATQLFYRFVRQ